MKYCIVIPAYNEEKRIHKLLFDLTIARPLKTPEGEIPLSDFEKLKNQEKEDGEFIFICEGKTNKTVPIIQKFKEENPELNIIIPDGLRGRLGKGGAVYEGFKLATSPVIGFMDADNSTTYEQMMILFTKLQEDDEGIIGSRYMPGSLITTPQPWSRRIQSRVFNLIIRTLFLLPYHDTQCGAKFFRKDSLLKVLPELRAKGFEFDVDLLWQMRRNRFIVKEAPIIWSHMDDANLKVNDAFSMLFALLRLRLGLLPTREN